MKILHTADWHLGQKLCDRDQREAHEFFLKQLLDILRERSVDVLLISGDVFDVGNPPNYALRQYYRFLTEAKAVCPHIIITGGNHDSVSTLNAPRELLSALNVDIVGGAERDLKDECILVRNAAGEVIGVVGAVPFLRDRDIRKSVAGESYVDKVKRIKEGIRRHYAGVWAHMRPWHEQGLPSVMMGHLLVLNASHSDSEKEIHIGNLGQVGIHIFPAECSYVALGHIHRPQRIGGQNNIRYSGSPIPLSFSEVKDQKQVVYVEFEGVVAKKIEPIMLKPYRKLIRFKGRPEELEKRILGWDYPVDCAEAWLEIQVELDSYRPNMMGEVYTWLEGKNADVLHVKTHYLRERVSLDKQVKERLEELNPIDVFEKRCASDQIDQDSEAYKELILSFKEILEEMKL